MRQPLKTPTGDDTMPEKNFGPVTRILSGIIGVLGVSASIYRIAVHFNPDVTWLFYVKYGLIAFACFVFLYAAIKGRNPLRTQ
jgi:hypothetical protein